MKGNLAHDEGGKLIETVDFDHAAVSAAVDREVEPESDLTELSADDIERGVKVLRVLLQWIWQNGMKNADGVKIRAIIVCWIFLKELRSLSETDVAAGYGMKKQSIGRWVDDFKRAFPNIRLPQMRS